MKKLLGCSVIGLLTIGSVGAREVGDPVFHNAESRTTSQYRIRSVVTTAPPVRLRPYNSGPVIPSPSPGDTTGRPGSGHPRRAGASA